MATMDKRIHAVIKANDVELRSRAGWRVQEVLKSSRVEVASESVSYPPQPNVGYATSPTYGTNTKSHVVEEFNFLMVQDETKYVADLQLEVERLRMEMTNARANLMSEQETLKNTRTALEQAQQRLKVEQEACGRERKLVEELRLSNRKMENDIAKIRVAVGERQMKDILNPEK